MKVIDIFNYLNSKYPISTACDFDNVGLLIGDENAAVNKAVVCLDCDINAVKTAVSLGAQLIITHHPVIFEGIKSVTSGSVVYELVKEGIAVISMHTNLDIATGGVTDCLCKALGLENVQPFTAQDGFLIRSAECKEQTADQLARHIKNSLGGTVRYADAENKISRLLICSGSGGDFLQDAHLCGFDALITADVKHNVFISALNSGISVFDAGHYHSENVIVKPLCERLQKQFPSVQFSHLYNSQIKFV